ncbi:alpha/beta hydrolase family protein [Conexibacter woesei]|uniref:Dipeptidyl aminopeptidase/acylaminoacyl-peptidase-like protein n=1 Tax=Conexibacter woesei (strain DSM 14684 / CCUG 47730 / CIP 108061 / JCM 11494 / NBRC 100937 / ID131577) TaxID=469383 RepID=D3F262_CONWI|nr:alpha/beta hydrolase [Conexibacter woesei]ADB50237.1 conserved hypothetical protein [Conexibacter woesei DSM 14684]
MRHHDRRRFFKDEEQQFLTEVALGSIAYRVAEAGEVLTTITAIDDGDRESWFAAWNGLGERLAGAAQATSGPGARDLWLRAAGAYAAAFFPLLGTKGPERFTPTWRASRDAWANAAELLGGEVVAIPYEDTTLPGWLFLPAGAPSGGRVPLVLVNNGSDGANVNAWVQGAADAVERGYAALVFDGPGQNAALHLQQLPFRPDWEAVIGPVVDWALTRPEVDGERIALIGVSQAGYWVPRAVAFEHRIAAAVADPGVTDVSTSWLEHLPGSLRKKLAAGDREGFDKTMGIGMRFSSEARFQMAFRSFPYEIDDPFDVYNAVLEYRLDDETIARIRCPTLVTSPEHEEFWPGQSQRLYDALRCPKELVSFTAAEGADQHCEPLAPALRNQRVFDWLEGVLR